MKTVGSISTFFKRNNETIPYKLYGNPIVERGDKNRIAYIRGARPRRFSGSICYVVLLDGAIPNRTLETP